MDLQQIIDVWICRLQYIPRNMHTVFALLCFVVVIHWLIIPYPSGLLHWHCGNLTIAPVPANQPWWIWVNTSREFIMNDCITTTKQSTTKPCAYFLGYTVYLTLQVPWPFFFVVVVFFRQKLVGPNLLPYTQRRHSSFTRWHPEEICASGRKKPYWHPQHSQPGQHAKPQTFPITPRGKIFPTHNWKQEDQVYCYYEECQRCARVVLLHV